MDTSPPLDLQPGWGHLYQSGAADAGVRSIEKGLWVTCMNAGEVDDSWVDHVNVMGITVVDIDDSPTAVLPDSQVFAQTEMAITWLSRGLPLLGHCGAGVSRASYHNLPIIMHARKIGFDDALALLRTVRPQADPNSGFVGHLRRLEQDLLMAVLP
jgi:dual specificity protein phosphatase-like protein